MEIGISGGGGSSAAASRLVGWGIHGFRTMEDLDIKSILNESKNRWLRPNEIHAILSNSTFFSINVKPVNLPKSGTILLFDRKMLRNFRKDGHNWKKKKDGKTVKEAHEHLKVGSEERIHVYYAHGQDNPNFVRRCYWLLDKALEHIVLVHYRETLELQGSPITPVVSHSGSELSDFSGSRLALEETDSGNNHANYDDTKDQFGSADNVNARNHAMRLHDINTLEWDELLGSNDHSVPCAPNGEGTTYFQQYVNNLKTNETDSSTLHVEALSLGNSKDSSVGYQDNMFIQAIAGQLCTGERNEVLNTGTEGFGITLESSFGDGLQAQDSFGRWMNDMVTDSPEQLEDLISKSSVLTGPRSSVSPDVHHPQTSISNPIFFITDISPSWASGTEETKILIIGFFYEEYEHMAKSTLYCICGEICAPVEAVQTGVFRCLIPPHDSGSVNFYLSIDRCKPISQVLSFEFRQPIYKNAISIEGKSDWEECCFQIRLARLLFSTSKSLDIFPGISSQRSSKEARKFILKTSSMIRDSWTYLSELIENGRVPLAQAKESLLELTLQNRLNEWLLERLVDGSRISERDEQGQGVLHLCAILGYTWAVYPFSLSGLSLDFRDKCGWTALHWAVYCGREHTVAALLSAGANPNSVTDPTSKNPGGCTAADLALLKGYDGLAAYLSEKSLVQQFEDMKIAGNASGSLESATDASLNPPAGNDEEIYLQDTLTAYRTAADAAARIQVAFREHSLKLRAKAVQFTKPEIEAHNIIAAMKIQNAFRSYKTKKKMAAAALIQGRFHTWKRRKDFLNLRRQAIKIQAAFRGFKVRKQYNKIIWSVGVLEKAILRWRLKRKGFRGLQVGLAAEPIINQNLESNAEEDFFHASQRQAEERVEKAVVCVQTMFRSRRAQEGYRRMKLAYNRAKEEFDESIHWDTLLEAE